MGWRVRIGLVTALAIVLVGLPSCNNAEEETDPSVDELVAIGKDYLVSGDGVGASDAFHAALDRDPASADAKYGIVLANTLQFTSLLSELLGLVQDLMGAADMEPVGDGLAPASIPVGDLIQDFVADIVVPKFDDTESAYADLAQLPDVSFSLPGTYDLKFMDTPLVSFGGDFDAGELHFFGTVNSLLLGVFRIVLAHDINFDFGVISNLDLGDGTDPMVTIKAVLDLLETLLTDPNYPNFLYLDGDGTEQMQSAGVNLGMAFLRLNMMLDAVRAETDDQTDDPIRYDDLNGNGAYDADEPITISGLTTIDPALVVPLHNLAGDLAVALFDETRFDVDPEAPNPLYLSSIIQFLNDAGLADLPVFGYRIGIPLGPFFAKPAPDGLRSLLLSIIDIWDLIAPFLGGAPIPPAS